MDKVQIIALVIIIITVIVSGGIIYIIYNSPTKVSVNEKEYKSEENTIETNDVQESKLEKDVEQNTQTENFVNEDKDLQEQITGKEEQQSNKQDSIKNNDETALDLAKQEWGIDVNSFKFTIENRNGNTYNISVRDLNGNAMTWYTVDVETGAVTQ